jgi:hypothetical protein
MCSSTGKNEQANAAFNSIFRRYLSVIVNCASDSIQESNDALWTPVVYGLARLLPGSRDCLFYSFLSVAINSLHRVANEAQGESSSMSRLDRDKRVNQCSISVLAFVDKQEWELVYKEALQK